MSEHSTDKPPLYKEILFTEEEVDARIEEMAAEIIERYKDKDPIFVSILNGAQPFAVGLMKAIARLDPHFHPNLQSMVISRYGRNRKPGPLRVITDLPPDYRDLAGRHAIIIEDLIDLGETIDCAKTI